MNLGNEPPSLDWHATTDSTSFDVIANIMVGLTRYGDDLTIEPCLASSWDILDGGSRYVFHLRNDIYWSDGKPVTAFDFQDSWRRLVDPASGASYAYMLYDVENGLKINNGEIGDPSMLAAHALDERTFEVRLVKPVAYFLSLTAVAPTFPVRRDIIDKHGDRWTEPENIVTNGPFLLDSWQHEYKIELKANPRFFRGPPRLSRVKMFMVPEQSTAFLLYENNELDYVDNRSFSTSDVERFAGSPEYRNFPLLRCSYIAFNVQKAPFTDARVRRAFAMAIDKTVFPRILRRRERPLTSWIPEGLCGYAPDSGLPFDPAAARRLLDQAGFKDRSRFPRVELLYPNREDAKLVVESVQAQLKANLGVKIELTNQEWKVYLARRKKDPTPLFRGAWGADYPDPETFMNLFTSVNGNNHTRWHNKLYDSLVSRAAGEQDEKRRAELYRKADRLLCRQEVPLIPAYLATQNVMVKPWAGGITFNALDVQYFHNAYVKAPAARGGSD